MAVKRYCLVGCGKSKRDGSLPARRKYDSSYFRKKRRVAEKCDGWWVLSAKHGAIPPNISIDDYDVTIDDVDKDRYHRKVYLKLRANDARWMGDSELIVLAGQKYIEPIEETLAELPAPVRYPFADTEGIGEQLELLTEMNKGNWMLGADQGIGSESTGDQTSLSAY